MMLRYFAIIGLSLVALGGANAATIPIDMTTTSGSLATCATSGCTVGTPTAFTNGGYINTLFSAQYAGSPKPTTSGTAQNLTTGATSTPFILNALTSNTGSCAGANCNTWYSPNTTNDHETLVVNLGSYNGSNAGTNGLFDIDKIYTLIQANVEAFGSSAAITVTVSGVASDGTTAISDSIVLKPGIDYRGTSNLQSITCTDANQTRCSGLAAVNNTQISGTNTTPGGSGGNTVITYNNVYNNGSDVMTNGTVDYYFDVQEIDLPFSGANSFIGGWADTVTIASVAASGGKQRIQFSGMTLDQVPEPGTLALFGLGFGLVGLRKLRGLRKSS